MTFWSNHGHLEHQFGKFEFRDFSSGLEVLLCITIPIRIANNPAHLEGIPLITENHPRSREIAVVSVELPAKTAPGRVGRPRCLKSGIL